MMYLLLALRLVTCPAPAAAASTDTVTVLSTSPITLWGNKAVLRDPQTGGMVDIVREKPAAPLPAAKKPAKKKKKPAAKKPEAKKPEAQPEQKRPADRGWALGHLNCMRSPAKLFQPGGKQELTWKPDEPQAPKLYRFGGWRKKSTDMLYDMPCGGGR